jgi:putative addiction module component (TIGR02574 family)
VAIPLDELKREAAKLSESERATLARVLIESLDPVAADDDVERAWREEIERRVGQINRGEVELIPGDVVFARVRQQLR